MRRSRGSRFTGLRGWLWLLVEGELKLWRIRSQFLLSFSTASFISLRCVSVLSNARFCGPNRPALGLHPSPAAPAPRADTSVVPP